MFHVSQSSFIASFQDVGASINACAHRRILAEGTLFLSGPVAEATDEENTLLRDKHKLKSIVNTKHAGNSTTAFNLNADDRSGQISESGSMSISQLLGLTYCWINLRSMPYTKKIMGRLPFLTRCKIVFHMLTWNLDNPSLTEAVTDVVYARGPIVESIDVLDSANQQICELFNMIIGHGDAYPLLICGGNMMRDQHLIVFLMLLLLELPVDHIQNHFILSVQRLRIDSPQTAGESEFLNAMLLSKEQWVSSVKQHLDDKYGGAEAYLILGGITPKTRESLTQILRIGSETEMVAL